jgi:RNA polymerase sigma-70 factor (ECF subfamily)
VDAELDYSQGQEALIVALARTGDQGAFAELVRRRQPWLRGLLRHCCGDSVLADDLAQQVFLQSWRKLGQLRDPARFGPWLKRLAINAWLAQLRSKDALSDPLRLQSTGGADEDDAHDAAPAQARGGDSTPVGIDLEAALGHLSAPVRLCVVLAYHEGMTHPEIARLTGYPLGTVKSHVHRGTRSLRELLAAYDDRKVDSEKAEEPR